MKDRSKGRSFFVYIFLIIFDIMKSRIVKTYGDPLM